MKIRCIVLFICIFVFSSTALRAQKNYIPHETQNFVLEETKTTKKMNQSILINQGETYTITYDLNGGVYQGNLTKIESEVEANTLAVEPDKSQCTRYNATFSGWYTESNSKWDFQTDVVVNDITLYAHWNWDNSQLINNSKAPWEGRMEKYFETKYFQSNGWTIVKQNSTKEVNGYRPIEMQGGKDTPFPEEDILTAISSAGVESTYGGCGPIAMIGIMDYYARYFGYTSIMNNPTKTADRVKLATDILKNTKTSEVSSPKSTSLEDNHVKMYSGSEKSTLTMPEDYVDGFTKVMKLYGLNQQITATNHGGFNIFGGKNSYINYAKESIDKGIPATMYTGIGSGNGTFSDHYVNLYEYKVFQGVDRFGKIITQTVFNARVNWGWGQEVDAYVDADILGSLFCGVITYDIKNKNQLIQPLDFAKDFVNSNGQGQYFFYDISTDITTANGFTFGTTRLRCGYIENEYLVLSANRTGAGLASLEMNFDIAIKAMNFDVSLWSGLEELKGENDYFKLFYKDINGEWQEQIKFSIQGVSRMRDLPDNYYTEFSNATTGIKFEVYKENPNVSDRNKGRIVIGDMNLFY